MTPRPDTFTVDGVPPGCKVRLIPMWASRPKIVPRLILVHTNAASVETDNDHSYRWALGDGHTKPHYHVERSGQGVKFLPTDRKGVCNYKADAFGLSIETSDLGWPNPGGACGFTPAQAETIARIVAYESIVHGFELDEPTAWDGHGCAAHTDPFDYPYWTMYRGKACPGPAKKAELRGQVFPRARKIKAEWLAPPAGDDLMTSIYAPAGCYARFVATTDRNGVAVSMRWLPTKADMDAFVNAGAVVRVCEVEDLKPVVLLGEIPTGDPGREWSADDFAAVVG